MLGYDSLNAQAPYAKAWLDSRVRHSSVDVEALLSSACVVSWIGKGLGSCVEAMVFVNKTFLGFSDCLFYHIPGFTPFFCMLSAHRVIFRIASVLAIHTIKGMQAKVPKPAMTAPEASVALFGGRMADVAFVFFIIAITLLAVVAFGG